MLVIKKATQEDIRVLSRKLLTLLLDKNSQVYQENVAKFGVPEEYVKNAFAEDTLLKAAASGNARFFLALENDEILGFAQTIQQDAYLVELARIIVFSQYARKGIGTKLLNEVVRDEQQKGITTIIVKTGKEETHARRFYEKHGFKQIKELTVEASWGKKLRLVIYQLRLKIK